MLKTPLYVLFVLVVSIVGGAWSVLYALDRPESGGAVTIGTWTAFAATGGDGLDPYSRARIARDGVLTLGRSEGLSFEARADTTGARLRADCVYRIEGFTPPARFWTMFSRADAPSPGQEAVGPGLHSQSILRQSDSSFIVSVSRQPSAGNWLRVRDGGTFSLVLTLYGMPAAASAPETGLEMPQITQVGCDA